MTTQEHFRISSHLKDIIGRDLVTNEFVAIFELVKNSFDANASRVEIGIDIDHGQIWIADDGKGMDADAIRDRWLFVAYSAKADGSEDTIESENYRNRIRPQGQYGGSKGIGRFSCDTLGETLTLYSKHAADKYTQKLDIRWEDFEANSRELFQIIGVNLEEVNNFPTKTPVEMPEGAGTVLLISTLRQNWNYDNILRLRRYLEKLIDPFGSTVDTPVSITVIDSNLNEADLAKLQGPVGNNVRDLLAEKTTRIEVVLEKGQIKTELVDRGRTIYRISEKNAYEGLEKTTIRAEIFYLNQSAKSTFTKRMGVRPVEFGSIFLFLNGFRIFPVGEENDDSFGLNRRKQQGTSRYFGTRDVMGRIDISASSRLFREASSRDAGLIEDENSRELYDAIRKKAIFRLERYVVGVNWPDKSDRDREDDSGLLQISTRERAARLIGLLASANDLTLDYYDPEIIEIFDEDSRSLGGAMKSLAAIAEQEGNVELLRRVEEARARQKELETAEKEASAAAHQARLEKARADERITRLEQQTTYLAATQDMTAEQMTLLLHQVLIYAGHIGAAVDRALNLTKDVTEAAKDISTSSQDDDLDDAAAAIRVSTRKVMDDLQYIHLENDRLMAVGRFASNARFDLETDRLEGDIVDFLEEYVNKVRASRDGFGSIKFESNDLSQPAEFRPVDLVIVVDNLMDNARKHGARKMLMTAKQEKNTKKIEVIDINR